MTFLLLFWVFRARYPQAEFVGFCDEFVRRTSEKCVRVNVFARWFWEEELDCLSGRERCKVQV
jgi:hypothetical protein